MLVNIQIHYTRIFLEPSVHSSHTANLKFYSTRGMNIKGRYIAIEVLSLFDEFEGYGG